MTDYTKTHAALGRVDQLLTPALSSCDCTDWTELARLLLPEPTFGSTAAELQQYRHWINYTHMISRGRLEKRLGRTHPALAGAWRALDDRAITLTVPILAAAQAADAATTERAKATADAAAAAAVAANAPNPDVAKRYPISGARPYHAGSQDVINLPDDPIPYAMRDRAMRLIGRLFSITREGRKQGILKQSGMTVIKSLMLNFANGKTGACYPSYEAIAERTGLGRSTVADAVALLADLGFLAVTNRTKRVPIFGRGGAVIGSRPVQTSNQYRLGSGNWLAIIAAAPQAAADAVARWLSEWQAFLKDLKAMLLRLTESKIDPETDTVHRTEGYYPAKPNRPSLNLRRSCRRRGPLTPRTLLSRLF